jgi:predicted Zn-dependent protease
MANRPTNPRRLAALGLVLAITMAVPVVGAAQTAHEPGFNLFSEEQDVEIGRKSAAEAERQLRLLNDRSVDSYVNEVVDRLARHVPGARYPYQVKTVNSAEVNAFALPGGYMYVNRGLIEAAATEGELASVLAHEMGHVALRHGTNQASKAYLAQAGLGILGGVLGRDREPNEVLSVIGGLGLNALFVKYGREAEEQADVVGAQTMARAGYDPEDMADFFDKLARMSRREPSRLEQFFSSHPAPSGRAARIRQEARLIGGGGRSQVVGGFEDVQAELRDRPRAPRVRTPIRGADGARRRDNAPQR